MPLHHQLAQAHNGTVHTTWPKEKLSKESKPNSEQPTLTPMAPELTGCTPHASASHLAI